jgi:hypothetical protein
MNVTLDQPLHTAAPYHLGCWQGKRHTKERLMEKG